jgi:HAAS domain-containing protein
MAPDPIDAYLDELLTRLRGPAADVRRTLVEAEAHLRDAVDDQVAAGVELAEAHRVAIERFGTADQVAATVNRSLVGRTVGQVLGALAWAAARMVAIGAAAVGVSAVLAQALAALTSSAFVFGVPVDATLPAARCAHWLAVQPGATTCAQAAMLENSSDTFQLDTGGALLVLAAFGVAVAVRAITRRARGTARAGVVLPPVTVPAIGATVFGVTGAGLLVAGLTDLMLPGSWGRGLWFVDAGVAILVALGYALSLARTVLAESYAGEPQP